MIRDHLPLQQGLRLPTVSKKSSYCIRDHLPLQQGLRPGVLSGSDVFSAYQRPSSITTRIKTKFITIPCSNSTGNQRPSSITTRIKTKDFCLHARYKSHQRPSSITTRIKTMVTVCGTFELQRSETIFHYNKD